MGEIKMMLTNLSVGGESSATNGNDFEEFNRFPLTNANQVTDLNEDLKKDENKLKHRFVSILNLRFQYESIQLYNYFMIYRLHTSVSSPALKAKNP